ncbi:unnamed protein product [Cuscuta epithymum]|uniref:Uncharacterized protein n=1 Tax=Cuscuta epithymum TaxID=186058 RepID=A0AAV0G9T0_9ASTE|nr:unnamed protein product [Cuscuta epithymum]
MFITSLRNDVIIVKDLPPTLKNAKKRKGSPTFKPRITTTPAFYISEVIPQLRKTNAAGLILSDGGSLQANVNEPSDGIDDDCESSRDEVSSISSYSTMKKNIHTSISAAFMCQRPQMVAIEVPKVEVG